MRIAVVGAGAMGRWSVEELGLSPEVDAIVVADYDRRQAETVAAAHGRGKATPVVADASEESRGTLNEALHGCDAVINCTQHFWNLNVMRAAAQAGAHYTDMGGLFHVTKKQLDLDDEFKRAGVTAVVSMGAAPGITNVLAGFGARRLDQVRDAQALVACVDATDWSSYEGWTAPYSLYTICDEFDAPAPQFIDGEWREDIMGGTGEEFIDFGPPIGTLPAHHTIHSEPITFWHAWKDQGLRSATWKLALPPDFTSQMKFLVRIGMTRTDKIQVGGPDLRPRDVLLKVVSELPRPTETSIKITVVAIGVVRGLTDGREVEWRVRAVAPPPEDHPDAGIGILTGVPPAVVAKMLVRGDIEGPGVFVPEQVVPPERFFSEMSRWGVTVDASMREAIT